ncbi:uncharacterized protein LOC110450824 [Mizuhopecten yessoensis]|uniref:Uncharacterized protein n=1 Tax=Mizuhopecten yessoensis TaxID=6573 RepID=A0A210QN41_MIZYE|nr:uncharacterized protein LOC110450824 [Mizuhopecten yessoensis]OWF50125.1 hypothetical protein KP79_PYT14084 [Mizuhopecten yessoensis]
MMKHALKRLIRAYPSLNLKINVTNNGKDMFVVLPGLRFDDVDHTGQPDIWRVFDMINRVEHAAFYNGVPFLDYTSLNEHNFGSIVKACTLEVKKDFYETTTPKAPLDVTVKLAHIGRTTFTTVCEMSCGGKMKPSVRIKNMHTLMNLDRQEVEEIPFWWRNRFRSNEMDSDKQHIINITPSPRPETAFLHPFAVPLSDTDISQRTRCSSYVRYFFEVASIASSREHFLSIKNFNEFHIKSMQMLYFDSTCWGDALTSACWEDTHPLTLHCNVSKGGKPVWYANVDHYSEVFGC